MRAVRSLSGLAGPNASLKDAGGGGVATAHPRITFAEFAGEIGDTLRTASITTSGVEVGDYLYAVVWATRNYDTTGGGTNGETKVTNAGWALLQSNFDAADTDHGFRIYTKIATADSETVNGTALQDGGLGVVSVQGVGAPPSGADLTNSEFVSDDDASPSSNKNALSDTTFDYVLCLLLGGNDAELLGKDPNSELTWLARYSRKKVSGDPGVEFGLMDNSGTGDCQTDAGRGLDLNDYSFCRLGLRSA